MPAPVQSILPQIQGPKGFGSRLGNPPWSRPRAPRFWPICGVSRPGKKPGVGDDLAVTPDR